MKTMDIFSPISHDSRRTTAGDYAMCGRLLQHNPPPIRDFMESLGLSPPPIDARYNLAPTQPVVTASCDLQKGPELTAELLTWGITPRFWRGGSAPKPLFNARAEGIWERANFRGGVGRRQCVIVVNGFYEWHGRDQPWVVTMADGDAMVIAGIWQGTSQGRECCIVTTSPNGVMGQIHDRMPVILDAPGARAWLAARSREETEALMTACPDDWIQAKRVSTYVNSTRHDGPECLESPPPMG